MSRKIALVTGGSRGLGRSAALHLARKGVDVVIAYRAQKDEADRVVRQVQEGGGRAVALPLDTADTGSFAGFAEELRRTLERVWGRTSFDYLVNNAGSLVHKSFEETTEDDFDAMMGVHLKGVYFLTQALLPLLAENGRILNVSSGLARFATPGHSAYAVSPWMTGQRIEVSGGQNL